MTYAEAEKLLAGIARGTPESVAAIGTVALEALKACEATASGLQQTADRLQKLARGAFVLAGEVKAMRNGAGSQPEPQPEPAEPARHPPGADESVEGMMDAAIAAEKAAKTGGRPRPPKQGTVRQRPAPAAASPPAGPTTDKDEALESMMDDAVAAEEAAKHGG